MSPKAECLDFLSVPRLLIGALQGRSGKTTVTLGLLRALYRQGLVVQPFKKGPDFIDPGWHTAAASRVCRNLDGFMMTPEAIVASLQKNSTGCRLSIIEGAMGLFDGLDLNGSSSSAEIAKITATPVILVVDATRMTRSVAALVLGCQHFDREIQIAGVVLNKVARLRQEKIMREAIEQYCSVPVIGALPKDEGLTIPDRHLGLITCEESSGPDNVLDRLADAVEANLDLEKLIALADRAGQQRLSREPSLRLSSKPEVPELKVSSGMERSGNREIKAQMGRSVAHRGEVTLGIIQDRVFSFYYPENLEELEGLGARLIKIDSLADTALPGNIHGLYIGGGFPEVFAADLERNELLRSSICSAAESMPIYAECGGLMYLGRSIITEAGRYRMTGVFPFDTVMEKKPQGHGYTVMRGAAGQAWFEEGEMLRGHEFHNSRIVNLIEGSWGLTVERGQGIDGVHEGLHRNRVFATYSHIHALGHSSWAESFLRLAREYRNEGWNKIEKRASV